MKIRNGFVSNSSSSSYIVAFKGVTEPDLRKLFVGNDLKIEAFGIRNTIKELKIWNSIGTTQNYWDPNVKKDKIKKYYWDQFVAFAVWAFNISRAINDGNEVAIVRITNGDENYNILHNESIQIIKRFYR